MAGIRKEIQERAAMSEAELCCFLSQTLALRLGAVEAMRICDGFIKCTRQFRPFRAGVPQITAKEIRQRWTEIKNLIT